MHNIYRQTDRSAKHIQRSATTPQPVINMHKVEVFCSVIERV